MQEYSRKPRSKILFWISKNTIKKIIIDIIIESILEIWQNNFKELERYKTGFGKDGVGFECKPENFKTGTVTLREAQKFIADIVSNDKQVWIDLLIT